MFISSLLCIRKIYTYVYTFAISHKMKYAALWYEKKKFDEKGAASFLQKYLWL